MGVTHTFVSGIADDPAAAAAGQVLPSHWNATHTVNVNLASEVSGVLPVANGGSGTATPSLVAGSNTAVSGTWPNQTIGFSGVLPVVNGGSGTATPSLVAGTNITVSGTWPNQTIDAAGGSPGGSTTQLQYNNAGAFGGASGLTTNGTELTIASGTKTADAPVVNATQTWNNAAITFTGLKFNATDTASNAASLLMDLQVGGTSRIYADKNARIWSAQPTTSPTANFVAQQNADGNWLEGRWGASLVVGRFRVENGIGALDLSSLGMIRWSNNSTGVSTLDTVLLRDAANTLAQRNGVNAQTLNVYNTYTSSTSYERGFLKWNTNVLQIGTEKGSGGGTARALELQTDSTTRMSISAGGGISFTIASGQSLSLNANRIFHYSAGTPEGVSFGNFTGGHGYIAGPNSGYFFAPVTAFNGNPDVAFQRHAVNVVKVTNGSTGVGIIQTPATTVGALPSAATAGAGARSFVTDATATTFLSTVAGGGANKVPVVSDGTNWLIG